METTQAFSILVVSVCAMHLATAAGAGISGWWLKSVVKNHLSRKPFSGAAANAGKLPELQMRQRSEWYVFFHCDDLVGRAASQSKPHSAGSVKLTANKHAPSLSGRRPEVRLTIS